MRGMEIPADASLGYGSDQESIFLTYAGVWLSKNAMPM